VENYFNYFTEIEEHFQKRRGSGLVLSTLDWALIETWKDAGIPLEAVLTGIDATFDKYDRRPRKTRKVNSLGYCAQEVLSAAEEMKEAAVGVQSQERGRAPGLSSDEIKVFLLRNVALLRQAGDPGANAAPPATLSAMTEECAAALVEMAEGMGESFLGPRLEDVERRLTILEEKLVAALTMTTPEAELAALRAEADREIGPYRSKMPGFQIEQLQKQFVHKRLFEKAKIPRLSLFYM
jgi:hypothetical protein